MGRRNCWYVIREWIIMPINMSDFLNNPFNTTMSTYTNLMGNLFFLIPFSVIGTALFLKTRNPSMIAMYLIGGGALLSGVNMYYGAMQMAVLYIFIVAFGFVWLFLGLVFDR